MNLLAINQSFSQRPASLAVVGIALMMISLFQHVAHAETGQAPVDSAGTDAGEQPAQRLYIREYRIDGVQLLPQIEVEKAVYPFLGPNRTAEDVEKARAALEQAYFAKGYQTVAVSIPPQQVTEGVVILQVVEGEVGRLRVRGSRYFSLDQIKKQAPSLAEGKVPNFNAVTEDIIALNQIPDRRVTPTLRAGVAPGTVDVDLNVEDTFPLHGSLELNNRYSQDTTELRLNATLRYDNLWQRGHSLSLSYQVAPERRDDAEVFSGSYLARLNSIPWLSLLAYGVKQDSDVSTIGDINVAGRGRIIGARALFTLPGDEGFFHTLSVGADYKHFDEGVTLGEDQIDIPITYYPFTTNYSATWQEEDALTQLNAGVTFHFRGLGSDPDKFDQKRYQAGGSFIYFRGDIGRTQELPAGLQLFAEVQGQLASQPLISSEQFSGGGMDTVRGYLESEALGDNGVIGSIELRSPSLFFSASETGFINEWRFYTFLEGGSITIREPLPEQDSRFDLSSIGIGTRFQLLDYFNGSLDLGFPLVSLPDTQAHDPHLIFRIWGEF